MSTEDAEQIVKISEAIVEMGAKNITCNWVDSRGGYVVVVDFGENHTCQAVDTNRVKAYAIARDVASMLKASMP